jgi:hypothetical protein
MAKKKSGKVYHTGVTDAIEPQPQVSRRRGRVVLSDAVRPHLCFLPFLVFEPAKYQGPTTQMGLAWVVSQNLVPKFKT